MALKQNPPRQAHCPPPPAHRRTELIVEIPDQEPQRDGAQSDGDHLLPHIIQYFQVTAIPSDAFGGSSIIIIIIHRLPRILPSEMTPRGSSQSHLHAPHTSDKDHQRQQGERILMEQGIFDVVVIRRDKGPDRRGENTHKHGRQRRFLMRERRVEHDACGVDHGQFVEKLHAVFLKYPSPAQRSAYIYVYVLFGRRRRGGEVGGGTFQTRMETKAPQSNDQVADESGNENTIVAIAQTVGNATVGEVDERQVCHRVDDFGGVDGGVVVLFVLHS